MVTAPDGRPQAAVGTHCGDAGAGETKPLFLHPSDPLLAFPHHPRLALHDQGAQMGFSTLKQLYLRPPWIRWPAPVLLRPHLPSAASTVPRTLVCAQLLQQSAQRLRPQPASVLQQPGGVYQSVAPMRRERQKCEGEPSVPRICSVYPRPSHPVAALTEPIGGREDALTAACLPHLAHSAAQQWTRASGAVHSAPSTVQFLGPALSGAVLLLRPSLS